MSEESISYGEDKENLLYILKKINVDEFGLGEEGLFRESFSSVESEQLSTKPVGSEIEILENIKATTFSNPDLAPRIQPFRLTWSFGINSETGVINLTTENRKLICFTAVHIAILYDYCTREMHHLEGHQSQIRCLVSDRNGDWIATSDEAKDGLVIVWNTEHLEPIFILFNPYVMSGVLKMNMSPCARYLITIGMHNEEYYEVDLWLWTFAPETPNGVYSVHISNGQPVKICFNPEIPEQIMLVFEKQIFLMLWDAETQTFCPPAIPQIICKYKIGDLTSGTYISECHECYASTRKGYILVFRSTLYSRSYEEGEPTNAKIFINAVKVTPCSIGVITSTKRYLVVGDSRGFIIFFDSNVRILYWLRNFSLGPITSISFSNSERNYRFEDSKILIKKRPLEDEHYISADCEETDIEEDVTKMIAMDVPFDSSLDYKCFLVNDFFVATMDSNIYAVDFLNNGCSALFHIADANISAIDAHDEKPYIIIGYENGRISLINYQKREQISCYILPKTEETTNMGDVISCIKYSPQSLHLACGRNNGEVWILEPVILTPKGKMPFRYTKNKIEQIEFSSNSLQFALYDNNRTVVLYNYSHELSCWEFQGKVRSHYEDINDLKFFDIQGKSVLYSIGNDRHMVEYNNSKVTGDENSEVFSVVSRERIEQSAIPLTFTYFSKAISQRVVGYFLISDDRHKLKLLHEVTKVPRALVLGPSYGCFKESPIKKMKIIQNNVTNIMRYMIFMCKRHLGIHMLPPDGNPFKYTGYLVHPTQITDFALSCDGQFAFTFGEKDRCVLQWDIRTRTVDLFNVMGGSEMEPFYCLIEGGRNGWLFQEIQDLFFYMQILQQENIDLPRRVSDTLNLSEIPDLVRTCGFYPSDFELETMMIDIRYRDFDEFGIVRDEITFVEFVKLFLNHRPAYGYNIEHIKDNFNTVCLLADYPRQDRIESHDLIYLLQTIGEPSSTLHKNLTTLLRITTYGENNFEFLPSDVDINFLLYEILGIDPDRTENQEYDTNGEDNESAL